MHLQAPTSDRESIIELLHRYFAYLDAHDAAGLSDCLSEDLLASHTLLGSIVGREAFLAVAQASFPGLATMQHYCSNERVTVEGDRARCHAYLYAQHVVERDGAVCLMPGGARYELDMVRMAGGWRISRLRNEVTWMTPGLKDVFVPPL